MLTLNTKMWYTSFVFVNERNALRCKQSVTGKAFSRIAFAR